MIRCYPLASEQLLFLQLVELLLASSSLPLVLL